MRRRSLIAAAALLFASGASAQTIIPASTTIQDVARLKGQGRTVLHGFGLVIGLPGTGDSGEQLLVARPLAKLLENQGNPVESLEELAESNSIALVEVTCTIETGSAYADDRYDITVSAINNPSSLEGGELLTSPLLGPIPGQGVYAFASGPVEVDAVSAARGRVPKGATMVREILNPTIASDGSLTLVIHPQYAGWTTTRLVANQINQDQLGLAENVEKIAHAMDERTVRVGIPRDELPNPANFIAGVLGIRFDPLLLELPARVVVDEREGLIIATDDVIVRPTVFSHANLVVNVVTPPIEPTEINPRVAPTTWAQIGEARRASDTAKLNDLLTALRQMDVPVEDQIAIIRGLHKSGALHGELIEVK